MASLSRYLEQRAQVSNTERLFFTEDQSTFSASAGVAGSHIKASYEINKYQEWESEFSEKFSSKLSAFEEKRIEQIDKYRDLLEENDINQFSDLKTSDEAHNLASKMRDQDVITRKKFEQFFAKEGGEGAKNVLGYHDFKNGSSTYRLYREDQYEKLIETGKVTAEETSTQGHHINDISSGATDPGKLEELFHPDNIRLMTVDAHLKDPKYGHGGSWSNPTSGKTMEVSSRKKAIVDENKGIGEGKIESFDNSVGVGIGIGIGLISAIAKAYRLKNDSRPWKKRTALALTTGLVKGVEAGGLALIAMKTRTAISSFGENEIINSKIEFANQTFEEVLPADWSVAFDAENVSMLTGFSASIAELRIIRSGIMAILQWRNSNHKIALNQFGKESTVIIAEESTFYASALLLDLVYEAGEDAIIPDPSGGFIVAARLTWSIGKKGFTIYKDKKTAKECKEIKLNGFYETAIASIVHLN